MLKPSLLILMQQHSMLCLAHASCIVRVYSWPMHHGMTARAKGRLFTVLTSKQPVVMPSWHWHDVISTDDANLVSFRKSPRLELAILDRFLQHKLHVLRQRQHAASFRPLHLALWVCDSDCNKAGICQWATRLHAIKNNLHCMCQSATTCICYQAASIPYSMLFS